MRVASYSLLFLEKFQTLALKLISSLMGFFFLLISLFDDGELCIDVGKDVFFFSDFSGIVQIFIRSRSAKNLLFRLAYKL